MLEGTGRANTRRAVFARVHSYTNESLRRCEFSEIQSNHQRLRQWCISQGGGADCAIEWPTRSRAVDIGAILVPEVSRLLGPSERLSKIGPGKILEFTRRHREHGEIQA
jgi:hypothetical protein